MTKSQSEFLVQKKFRKTYPSVAVEIKDPEDFPYNRRAGYNNYMNNEGRVDVLYLSHISSNTATESEVLYNDIFEYVAGKEKRF